MRKLIALLVVWVLSVFVFVPKAYAVISTPSLGQAASFVILSSTYTNTVGGTTLTGDLGYTTGPAVTPTVNGSIFSPPASKYSTAGTDQGSALSNLNNQTPCTSLGAAVALNGIDLGLGDGVGVFIPGCYTSTGAMSITKDTTVTLKGEGTYIFRPDGALTTGANAIVALTGGASACDVFWTPTGATTLGANTTFKGTDIDAAGITIGSTVGWVGRALAYGGTVSTATDTINSTSCTASTASSVTFPAAATPFTNDSAAPCIASPITNVPLILQSNRISPTSVSLNWGPYAGSNTFIVRYGLANGNYPWSTKVTGFSTTLNALPENQPIWVQVAATNNCATGTYSEARQIGGPGLPNTGFAPNRCSPKH